MSKKEYSPLRALNRTRRAMDSVSAKHTPASERPLTLATNSGPIPCAVLLRSLVEKGPVPDDFLSLGSALAIREHKRPDGAVYIGAFELQGDRSSVVLVWGPPSMTDEQAEQIATIERKALTARHESFLLGPFAARPAAPSPTNAETA